MLFSASPLAPDAFLFCLNDRYDQDMKTQQCMIVSFERSNESGLLLHDVWDDLGTFLGWPIAKPFRRLTSSNKDLPICMPSLTFRKV